MLTNRRTIRLAVQEALKALTPRDMPERKLGRWIVANLTIGLRAWRAHRMRDVPHKATCRTIISDLIDVTQRELVAAQKRVERLERVRTRLMEAKLAASDPRTFDRDAYPYALAGDPKETEL